jgi:hypothetical protein
MEWIAAAGGWLVLTLLVRLATAPTRPRPGAPTTEPGPEPPAVAALLVAGRRWVRPALAATVLDLGARGWLDLVRASPMELVCRIVRKSGPGRLLPFEERVLDRASARVGGGPAPVAALLPDPADADSRDWEASFGREVEEVALGAGLVRPRLRGGVRWALLAAASVPAVLPLWLAWASGNRRPEALGLLVFVALAVLRAAAAVLPHGVTPTAAGRTAASRWLGVRAATGVAPARAVAAGAAPEVLAAFAPPSAKEVWSGYGGRWRTLRVDLADGRLPRSGPMSPRFVALVGGGILLLVAIPMAFPVPVLLRSAGGQVLLLVPFAILSGAIGYAWWATDRHRRALAAARTFDAQVVRRWTEEDSESASWYLAVDDGQGDRTRTWSVEPSVYERFPTGSRVRVTIDGLCRLMGLQPV